MGSCFKSLCGRKKGGKNDASPDFVEEYLNSNPTYLDKYVADNVHVDTLEKWYTDRSRIRKRSSYSYATPAWKSGDQSNDKKLLVFQDVPLPIASSQHHQHNSSDHADYGSVIWELCTFIKGAVNADSFQLYFQNRENETIYLYTKDKKSEKKSFDLSKDEHFLPSTIGIDKKPKRLTKEEAEKKYSGGFGVFDDNHNDIAKDDVVHILAHPLLTPDNDLCGVLVLYRTSDHPFFADDEHIVNSYLIWGGISLHYAEINSIMNIQKRQNEFLLNVVNLFPFQRSIFQDIISMDLVVRKIMNFAQKLVNADRASLFLVDHKNKEVYARLFDMGHGSDLSNILAGKVREIRFPIGIGIAGLVADTGEILNIPNAYSDPRFNRRVDKITGYKTETILCMPILIRGSIIGVVQMVNKKKGPFTKEDEMAFETFAIYCGLALHHAKLYDKIKKSEQKYKVALEVLSYHATCSEDEVSKARDKGVPERIVGIEDFAFVTQTIDDIQKAIYTVYMFVDLFGNQKFEIDSVYRFVLSVKKNYRRVPYHNWTHGFTVAHTMYCILKKNFELGLEDERRFKELEGLSLFIGALCHDLDHRGRNNKFMADQATPLASIYSTSTLEHHHFNQTVTILQQERHNILSKLSANEYKEVLGNIKHCILSTDLAIYITKTRKKIRGLIDTKSFNWDISEHKLLIQAICMTSADLCASAKPWDVQVETVKVIFEEFYEQGDIEKAHGGSPIAMMDRSKTDYVTKSQVMFLTDICIPCYEILSTLIPGTDPLLTACKSNLDRWKVYDEEAKKNNVKNPFLTFFGLKLKTKDQNNKEDANDKRRKSK